MAQTAKQIVLTKALLASEMAFARLRGMKIHAFIDPPRAATGGFPYPARTCEEWADFDMTDEERLEDAQRGSAMLRDAILRAAA